nr:hypothetical protein [Clostridium thermarum]
MTKILILFLQVILFSTGIYLSKIFVGDCKFTFRSLLSSVIPSNYFVVLYSALFIISPYINIVLKGLSDQKRKQLVFLLLLIFSVYPTLVDVFAEFTGREWRGLSSIGLYGSQWGYSIVNFVLLYIIGAYIRMNQVEFCKKKLGVILLLCVLVLAVWARINELMSYSGEKSAWAYSNPVVIVESAVMFLIFNNINIKSNIINYLAKGGFSVFLLHSLFIRKLNIEKYVGGNPLVLLMHLTLTSMIIYLVCWAAYFIYDKLMTPIHNLLTKYTKNFEVSTQD